MRAHALPNAPCWSASTRSSSRVHSPRLMLGSRWLCHLRAARRTVGACGARGRCRIGRGAAPRCLCARGHARLLRHSPRPAEAGAGTQRTPCGSAAAGSPARSRGLTAARAGGGCQSGRLHCVGTAAARASWSRQGPPQRWKRAGCRTGAARGQAPRAPLAALLADPAGQLVRDHRPALGAQAAHQVHNLRILLRAARRAERPRRRAGAVAFEASCALCCSCRRGPASGAGRTSGVQGPLMSSGLSTFCQRCRHCTSERSSKYSAAAPRAHRAVSARRAACAAPPYPAARARAPELRRPRPRRANHAPTTKTRPGAPPRPGATAAARAGRRARQRGLGREAHTRAHAVRRVGRRPGVRESPGRGAPMRFQFLAP